MPFFAYTIAFLFLPAGSILLGAFEGKESGWTVANVQLLFHHPYIDAYKTSIEISLVTALAGGIAGLFIAYAALRDGTPRWVRSAFTTFAGVAANFGGIPLAFAFIATIGPLGIVTVFFRNHGYDLSAHGITPFSKLGVELAYLYFQLPLMILVISPAIDGLRREWREAASNLGAKQWQFWRYVGLPVLMPSILGAMILLFGNAFGAQATAYQLTGGALPLATLVISAQISGDVLHNPGLGYALAMTMVGIMAVSIGIYTLLQRRAERWLRS